MITHSALPARSEPTRTLSGDIKVPGDKSISHRALILASQLLGRTSIEGLLEGEDVMNTAAALQSMGVRIERDDQGRWHVWGVGTGGLSESMNILEMGNSGTSTRLLMGLIASYPYNSFFAGDTSLSRRPMARVITPLSQIGARIIASKGDTLPLCVQGAEFPVPITYRLPVASAQVKSAILLAALNTPGTTTIIEPLPTRDHTERMLEFFNFPIARRTLEDGSVSVSVSGQPAQAMQDTLLKVPGDPSSAAFLSVAALITPKSNLTLRDICVNPLRIGLFDTLQEMGGQIEFTNRRTAGGEEIADITVRHSTLHGVTVPAARAPSMIDEYPILSAAAACASGTTRMLGLGELRVKESDRLSAIVAGLIASGVKARAEGDTLIVDSGGKPPSGGGLISTHYDHRIAMAFLVLGMASINPIRVDDTRAIATSFPNFVSLMNAAGARITAETARA